jgi:hypothetical protein
VDERIVYSIILYPRLLRAAPKVGSQHKINYKLQIAGPKVGPMEKKKRVQPS